MKFFVVVFLLLSLGDFAISQPAPLKVKTADIDAQRAVIAAERNSLEASFLSEDAACYKKFTVNSCLEDVNARRRGVMMILKRKEIELNDAQRESQGAQQIRKTNEKASFEQLQEGQDRRTKSREDFEGRKVREQENMQRRTTAASNEKTAREASVTRLQTHQRKSQARADKQANAAEEEEKFKQNQFQAQQRQAQHEIDQVNRVKPAAKTLPLPQ